MASSLAQKNGYVRELLRKWKLPRGARVVSFADEWDSQRNYFVKGVVANEGTERLQRIRVIAERRDPKNVLVGTGQTYVEPEVLGPGESGSFRILVRGSFSAPSPPPEEPRPDCTSSLGPRPTIPPAAGSPGSVLSAVTALVQTRQMAAQKDWDSKCVDLLRQWESRIRSGPKQGTTGETYFAYVAPD